VAAAPDSASRSPGHKIHWYKARRFQHIVIAQMDMPVVWAADFRTWDCAVMEGRL
jgi:hypothetical protein